MNDSAGALERLAPTLRVLLVGGGPRDVALVRATLEHSAAMSFELAHAPRLTRALGLPDAKECDVVLLDVSSDQGDGLASLALARARFPLVPIVVLAERDDEMLALRAVQVGADGYLVKSELDAAKVAEKILEAVRRPMLFTPQSSATTASIGVATFPQDGAEPEELVQKADIAMYHAKKRGRDRIEFYTEDMNAAVLQHAALESRLRSALELGQFVLHYQPQYDVRSARITGAEALIRWEDPGAGLIPPARFLPVAEDTGLIVPIGEWVMRAACQQTAAWQLLGHRGLRISVNVASRQFQEHDFVQTIRSALEESGIPAFSLELEITESSLLEDVDLTVSTLRALKDLGVHLAIDDFGTGYSSLSYLKRLPLDVLKIDQSFVRAVTGDPKDATITAAVVNMARALGLTTVAEGIESLDQLLLLGSYGCNRMQGYLFGKPAPPETFVEWLVNPPFRWMKDVGASEP